ncbi:MAG: hypothetical protein AAGI68_15460 [Planctomycetota bacterium]
MQPLPPEPTTQDTPRTLIHERVEQARAGTNPAVICRTAAGWAVLGDTQFLRGYCLLLPDPVVPTLNDLQGPARTRFLNDMAALGDAVLAETGCARINYSMLGNLEPALHAHVFPRYADEPEHLRAKPIWLYPESAWTDHPIDPDRDAPFMQAIRQRLETAGIVRAD